jgi:ribonuclease HI
MIKSNALNIYTDGSAYSHPRMGGIGIRFIKVDDLGNETREDSELRGYQGATNIQMELQAVIMALKKAREDYLIPESRIIYVFTDCQYVSNNYINAMFVWPKKKWMGIYNQPIEHAKLWKELIKEIRKVGARVYIEWVKGHNNDEDNKAVDRMAKRSAKNAYNKPLAYISVRRKKTRKSIKKGCVGIEGQRITIRMFTCQELSEQRLWKYNYEVVSKNSKYFGLSDKIVSDILLKDGHTYYVKFNKEQNNPRIMKLYKEVINEKSNRAQPAAAATVLKVKGKGSIKA